MRKITLLMAALVISFTAMAVGMSGTYKVGTTETSPNYASLSAAITDINTNGVAGDIILEITSDITEAANIGLGVNTNGFSIKIRPDIVSDANTDPVRTITFTKATDNTSPSGHFVIGYTVLTAAWADANTISTNNVSIDGFAVGGTTKRLKFTTASGSLTASRLIMVIGGCTNTTVKNCFVENKSTGGSALCIGTIARKLIGTGEVAPTTFTIENNVITSVASSTGQGLMTSSSGTLVSAKTTGLIVKNNIITAQGRCGWFYYINGAEFSGNEFHLTQLGSSGTVNYGLWTSTGATGTFNIFNNRFIETTTMEAGTTGTLGMRTMSLGAGIYNIYNNIFAGMDRKGAATVAVDQSYVFFGGTSGHITNNTFYMPALTTNTTPGYYQAIKLSFANPDIKNNIFISNEDAMINAFLSAVTTGVSDYNVFYNKAGTTKSLIVLGTTNNTLASYQAANPTKDRNSKNIDVNFTSATNLSLTGASIGDYQLAVPRQATVLTDITGTTNRATLTYAGAYEASDLTTLAKQFTATAPNGTAHVYIVGDFTGKSWNNTTPFELVPTGTANQFSGIFPCINGVNYKYVCETGDWDYQAAVSAGGGAEPNHTYNASDVVAAWLNMKTVKLNVSFATAVPSQLFVKGSWDAFATPIELTKSGNTFSTTLSGILGNKIPSNTQYKYYTNDNASDNWENYANNTSRDNRWSIAPAMNDVVDRFTTWITTEVNEVETTSLIARTYSGIQVTLDSEATIEIYNMSGMLIDKTKTVGTYSHDLNNGIYIVRINGKATKFIK